MNERIERGESVNKLGKNMREFLQSNKMLENYLGHFRYVTFRKENDLIKHNYRNYHNEIIQKAKSDEWYRVHYANCKINVKHYCAFKTRNTHFAANPTLWEGESWPLN